MPARARIAVVYNVPTLDPSHPDAASERGVVATASAVIDALKAARMKPFRLGVAPPITRFVRRLDRQKPDAVFNLAEGFGGAVEGEAWVASMVELMGLPYSGCPPLAIELCRRKQTAKRLLRGSRLPTADAWTIAADASWPEALGPDAPWPGPRIVKPEGQDASLGLDQSHVVTDHASLADCVGRLLASHRGDVMVEDYLPGAEFNVGVIDLDGPVALPVAEVRFRERPGAWPILTYDAKWRPGSHEDLSSPVRCPAEIPGDLAATLSELAVRAFRATGCRDVARVDFRLDAGGRPMILEVNPNPDLDPRAGWARALEASGRRWDQAIVDLTRKALGRRT